MRAQQSIHKSMCHSGKPGTECRRRCATDCVGFNRRNSIISGNYIVPPIWGGGVGAGIYCSGLANRSAYPLFRNCTILGDRGSGSGAGVRCGTDGVVRIENCIVVGNIVTGTPEPNGTQVRADGCMTPAPCMDVKIRDCVIEDVPNALFVGAWSLPYRTNPPVADYIKVDPNSPIRGIGSLTTRQLFTMVSRYRQYHLRSQAGRWNGPAVGYRTM